MTPYGDEARIQCPCDNSPELTRGQFAFKRCSEDGRWMETDYAACIGEALEAFCIVRTNGISTYTYSLNIIL